MSDSCYAGLKPTPTNRPIIIGHRGAPGVLPEHTMQGYALAIEQGADYIECDMVLTSDKCASLPVHAVNASENV